MKKRLSLMALLAGLVLTSATPVSAGEAWVDRIADPAEPLDCD